MKLKIGVKLTLVLLTFLICSCEEKKTVIKTINNGGIEFMWYRGYCGSNGCDFVTFDKTIIYKYYDFALKNISWKKDTLYIYHVETKKKGDFHNYLEGNFKGKIIKFIPVPNNTCNYLQLKNKNPPCMKITFD